ncbi:hypothetical protein [Gloeocapsopsis dulcis]|uniref:Uncharacterized protein n=1 Tax=Gloeocapsopsis dulcis AAB1 = 1H9 TaxID=1433147 RepID=A0A6N8G5X7_9CHRO|nr:hypothetical protein [Gloeocapsopsis dulcis]MUL39347.1 hypothetical protein [Gloeocapsopsis dulcis AAB1 = 1H9]WNN89697.1 hypothetical protein P0S91_00950 [Gloeocapsopsis dulcis]
MAPILEKFVATITKDSVLSRYYFLQAPNSYAGSIDTVSGITKAPDAEKDEPIVSVGSLLQSGKVFRVAVQYDAGGRRRTGRILVTRDKLATALDALIGKSFRGGVITSARIPTKATFF